MNGKLSGLLKMSAAENDSNRLSSSEDESSIERDSKRMKKSRRGKMKQKDLAPEPEERVEVVLENKKKQKAWKKPKHQA